MRLLITSLWQKANLNIKIASSIVIISVIWMLTGIINSDKEIIKKENKPVKTVAIQQFSSSLFTPKLEFVAQTEAENAVTISSEIHGKVEEKVSDGTFVNKGDTLLKLSIDTLQSQLSAAKAHLEEAKELYKSAKQLKKEGFKASTDLAAKKSDLEDAKLAVKAVEVDLQRINIKAPQNGKVDRILPEIGEYVVTGQNIVHFIGEGNRKLVAHAAQKQRHLITVGTPVSAKLVNGVVVDGNVESIAIEASDLTKTYRITATLNKSYKDIPIGMTARLNIPTTEVQAYQVPHSTLVLNSDGIIGVMIAENKIVKFTPIKILEDSQEGIWVTGIHSTDANIVIRGQTGVIDGEEVTILQETIKG